VHGLEDAVGSGLEREMHVFGQLGQAAEAVDQILAETDRVGDRKSVV
jgi:hypothetical protein